MSTWRERRKQRQMPIPRLPLIALIDVVLFLLLYFMIAGSLASDEANLAATLASSSPRSGQASPFQPQTVRVEREAFRVGERLCATPAELATVLSKLPKDAGVVVRSAPDAPVAGVAAALRACRDAGFLKVAYAPQSP